MTTAIQARESGQESRLWNPITVINFGAIETADADGLIKAATSTKLPNNETVTYTFPAANTAPTDSAIRTGVLETPRNVVAVATHNSSVVASTVTVNGFDVYGNAMSEILTIAATGVSQTASGKKAFSTISSIAITSAGNSEANTLNIGTGNVIGLPYKLATKNDALFFIDGVIETAPTAVVVASTATATATTGDVRGTVDFSSDPDGTREYAAWVVVSDASQVDMYGVAQF